MKRKIDLSKLIVDWNPFQSAIWSEMEKPITIMEVEDAIKKEQFISPDIPKPMYRIWDTSTREQHISRVAWFVTNYQEKYPIEIDFGIPGFCYLTVEDGNHRLAAAIYLNLPFIWAIASGSTNLIREYGYKSKE